MELILANWEYILIGILAIDKAVALSPTKWDDLIWTSLKKAIFKALGKKMLKLLIKKLVAKHGLVPLLLQVGDLAVKATKSKKDDKAWAKVKKILEAF